MGKNRGGITARLSIVEMRMEHHVCATPGRPADRLRISPAFMANGDPECQMTSLENAPLATRRVGALLAGIELNLILEPGNRAVGD